MRTVVNVITDSNIGGAGRALLTYLRGADRSAFRLITVLPTGSLLTAEVAALGVECREIDGIGERSFNHRAVSSLRRLFEELQPDIVHTHAAMSARVAARLYGKCKIAHTRHSVFDPRPWQTTFPFKQLMGAVNNALSDKIIAVSPAAKANMTDAGTDPRKVVIVFNGVDPQEPLTEAEKRRELARLGLSEEDFVCAVIARLDKVKGHEYILKAAELFKTYHPRVRVIVAGAGAEDGRLRRMAEDKRLDNVIFAGFVKDIRAIEGIMHLQLNASYGTEATSLSLLEGMSLGVPAVVSDFGGNPFVIQDGVNGLVVPAKNHLALFEAVAKLMGDEQLYRQTRENALKVFYERFTSGAMVDGVQAVYRDLLGGGDADDDGMAEA